MKGTLRDKINDVIANIDVISNESLRMLDRNVNREKKRRKEEQMGEEE